MRDGDYDRKILRPRAPGRGGRISRKKTRGRKDRNSQAHKLGKKKDVDFKREKKPKVREK